VARRRPRSGGPGSELHGFLRAFAEPVLVAALNDMVGAAPIVKAVYQRVAERLRVDPMRFEFRCIALGVLPSRL